MNRAPLVKDQNTAILAGAVCVAAGTFLLWDAFDARGSKRPFWLSFLPGL